MAPTDSVDAAAALAVPREHLQGVKKLFPKKKVVVFFVQGLIATKQEGGGVVGRWWLFSEFCLVVSKMFGWHFYPEI